MRNLLLYIFCLLAVHTSAQELNVMSFNIRLNTASDSLNAWPYRKDLVASQVLYHRTHILGVQEALPLQMTELRARLAGYRSIGVGRDDGKDMGEYSAIFYDTSRVDLLRSETFWLSQTPAVAGSKHWDAAYTRIVTWGSFRDKTTKKEFFVFNTHFDHIGQVARRESAMLLKKKVNEIAGAVPTIIMGDFNAKPTDEPIVVLMEKEDAARFIDTKMVSVKPHYGPTGTFNGFRSKEVDNEPIDYIFIRGKWKVMTHATISQTWGGRFASDHFAVISQMKIE
jgi:endonuclease/exonuclease/phosphatase family metal-dependent hydrolase